MKADRFMPLRSISTKYTATSTAVSMSARRGTSPAAAPFAKYRGRSPSRPSAAPSFANAGRYAFITPRPDDRRDDRDQRRPDAGGVVSDEVERDQATHRPIAEHADRHDLQGRVARADDDDRDAGGERDDATGFLNSPAMCVPTSQPAKAQTKRLIAVPTPPHPLGRNGWKFDASTAGKVTATTPTTVVISSPVSTNCAQPATRTPNQFATNGGTKDRQRDDGHRGPVHTEHGDDVLPAEHREHGASMQTPKKNQYPVMRAAVSPGVRARSSPRRGSG